MPVDKLRQVLMVVLESLPPDYEDEYGHYMGGDPRDFTPDLESCTAEEIRAHAEACAAAAAGAPYEAQPHRHVLASTDTGILTFQSERGSFGLGIRRVRNEPMAILRKLIQDALDDRFEDS